MTVKLLAEHLLEFQSVKGGCIGSSESKYRIVANHMSRLTCLFCGKESYVISNSIFTKLARIHSDPRNKTSFSHGIGEIFSKALQDFS